MNCKNCKNWVFGRCTVSNLIVGPGQLCNAWELSASYEQVKLPYATFDEKEFQKRIAELEEKLAELVEAVDKMCDVTEDILEGDTVEMIYCRGIAEEARDVLKGA